MVINFSLLLRNHARIHFLWVSIISIINVSTFFSKNLSWNNDADRTINDEMHLISYIWYLWYCLRVTGVIKFGFTKNSKKSWKIARKYFLHEFCKNAVVLINPSCICDNRHVIKLADLSFHFPNCLVVYNLSSSLRN